MMKYDDMMIEASRQDDPSNKTLDLSNKKMRVNKQKDWILPYQMI